MTETYVSYAPGDRALLARGGRYLLVETALADGAIGRLWDALEQPAGSEEVLAVLAGLLPGAGFCLVEVDGGAVRVAQAGIAAVLDGRPVAAGAGPTAVPVPPSGGMIIAATGTGVGALQVPIESGVVAAGAVVVVQVGDAPVAVPEVPEVPDIPEISEDVEEAEPTLATDTLTQLWDDVPELDPTATSLHPVELTVPTLATAPPPQPLPPVEQTPSTTGDTVLAGICLNGHYSGAYGAECRVCGDPMPTQTPRTIPRPSLGVLVLEDGSSFDLDRGAVLGRAPHVPEGTEADQRPHLVNLATYGRDISRQHAEVIVRGWSVFVRDLGSANGTRVHDASGQVTVLEAGASVPLQPGSVIDVAEVTSVEYRTS